MKMLSFFLFFDGGGIVLFGRVINAFVACSQRTARFSSVFGSRCSLLTEPHRCVSHGVCFSDCPSVWFDLSWQPSNPYSKANIVKLLLSNFIK